MLEAGWARRDVRVSRKEADSAAFQSSDPSPTHPLAMPVRALEAREIDTLTTLWYDGWQDAHAALLPEELARARTWDSFRERLRVARAEVRVVGDPGAPLGFYLTKGDELHQ